MAGGHLCDCVRRSCLDKNQNNNKVFYHEFTAKTLTPIYFLLNFQLQWSSGDVCRYSSVFHALLLACWTLTWATSSTPNIHAKSSFHTSICASAGSHSRGAMATIPCSTIPSPMHCRTVTKYQTQMLAPTTKPLNDNLSKDFSLENVRWTRWNTWNKFLIE